MCNEKPHTNRHILSNCGFPSQLERYKTRHNNIMVLLARWRHKWSPDMKSASILLLPVFPKSTWFSNLSVRPDLIIFNNSSINVIELSLPWIELAHCSWKSKLIKQNKYKNLKMFLQPRFWNHIINVFTLKVSTLGFISDISKFCSISKIPHCHARLKKKLLFQFWKTVSTFIDLETTFKLLI